MRTLGVVAVLALGGGITHADPELAASGFVGVGYFPDDNELGNSWAPEQVPTSAPVVGGRIGWLAVPALVERDALRLSLGVEAELSLATSYTGSGARMSYFAPVFGWRAHALARLTIPRIRALPHLVVGAGGETVASSSPFMAKETDPVVYWGPGVAVPIAGRWQVRVDLRHGIVPAQGSGATSTLELQVGVAARFGLPRARGRSSEREDRGEVSDADDSDGDGLPDRVDRCPRDKETVNGVGDDDGCPEADGDGDGVIGAADRCPTAAEDFDAYQDADGCPDSDNDGDAIVDARDACPLAPETKNGIADEDGCPDQVPREVIQALATGSALAFEPTRARVTKQAEGALRGVLAQLDAHPELRLSITAHPERAGDEDLARRRAEAVKWFIVDQGVVQQDRLTTRVGDIGKQPIELAITVR